MIYGVIQVPLQGLTGSLYGAIVCLSLSYGGFGVLWTVLLSMVLSEPLSCIIWMLIKPCLHMEKLSI